jgi:hypothetical protein
MSWTSSDSLDQLLPALVAAQTEFPAIPKDGYNPHFKSKFSTLKAIKDATLPVLARHGLTLIQFPGAVGPNAQPGLTTWLAHTSGQFIADTSSLALAKSDPQAQGSAITYMRRYAWSSILGLVTDDDDDANVATLADPKVGGAKLNEIKQLAEEAGIGRDGAQELAKKLFGKPVPSLTPAEADKLATDLAKKVTEKALT